MATLEGKNIYQEVFPSEAVLVLGNEANGISSEILREDFQKVTIPQRGGLTESLNVATAGAILLSEMSRGYFLV